MKKTLYLFFLSIMTMISVTSCLSDQCTDQIEYTRYDAVYMDANQFRVDQIVTEDQKQLENPGKIYYYNDFLFINQLGEGVHIYDNSDSANPTFVKFYKIPGNFDIVIKDGLMLADNVIDLITIDISDINNPVIIDRQEDYNGNFSWAEDNPDYRFYAYSVASPAKEVVDCSDSNFGRTNFWRGDVWLANGAFGEVVDFDSSVGGAVGSGSGVGIAGSTARFTIVGDYFYTVDNYSLNAFKFDGTSAPVFENENDIGWGIETIFPYKNNLFIGSTSGMHIFSLANPASPSRISSFEHARACDPVVVNGDIAYVTLRDGNACNGFTNQLDIIDISSLTNPTLIKSHSMKNPHGLSVDGDKLYLSEGSFGLKVLDVSNSENLNELSWDKSINSKDIIYLGNNHLMSIGSDGFYQYDVTDPRNIVELSHILVK